MRLRGCGHWWGGFRLKRWMSILWLTISPMMEPLILSKNVAFESFPKKTQDVERHFGYPRLLPGETCWFFSLPMATRIRRIFRGYSRNLRKATIWSLPQDFCRVLAMRKTASSSDHGLGRIKHLPLSQTSFGTEAVALFPTRLMGTVPFGRQRLNGCGSPRQGMP